MFADPWLPPVWNRPLEGPERCTIIFLRRPRSLSYPSLFLGTAALAHLDASCSTMLAAARDGSFYTALCDYDTLGNNVYFEYNQVG